MPPGQQAPIDYLNQIAPPPEKRDIGTLRKIAIFGGGLAVVVLLLLLFSSKGDGTLPGLSLRIQSTLEIADGAQKIIKSSELRSINSNYITFLNETNQSLSEELVKQGVNMKKLDSETLAKASKASSDLAASLEDARLNAVYDRSYAREMDFQLSEMRAMMLESYEASKSKKFKAYLNETDDQLVVIQEQFSDFNG